MSSPDVQARLARWRAQGAIDLDPIGYARIDALARRAATTSGAVRALLDARLSGLIDAYAAHPATTAPARDPAVAPARRQGGLTALLQHLAARDDADVADVAGVGAEALDDIRRLSARVRTESQVRQALDQAPENAGPLNSANLVHRALVLMCEDAPDYLAVFMDYIDTLARLESMELRAGSAATETVEGATRRRRRRPAAGA